MFLCRAVRLPAAAAALDRPFRSPGSFVLRLRSNRRGHVTVTVSTRHHRVYRASSGRAHLSPKPPRQQEQQQDSIQDFDAQTTRWAQLDRVNLHRRLDFTQRHNGRAEPAGYVSLSGAWKGSCCTAMQIRASSTAAAASKKSGEQTDSNKGDMQTLKETSSTSPTEKGLEDTKPEGGKPTKAQQLKKVFKEYGAVGVSFHIGISLMSLGMFYLLISSGIDMAALLCKLGFSEVVVKSKMASGTSTFVLAYAIHKLFAPARISITLVSVPLIVRYFRKTGLFKPPTPAP
ncbi:protein FAM210B, mitochondrial [Pholidichthys leucotaenia]